LDAAALDALDHNHLEANRIFSVCSARGEFWERRDVALVSCGLPAEALNWGFLKPPHGDAIAAAAAVRGFFAERKLPFQVRYRDDGSDPLAALAADGWQRRDPTPGMALRVPSSIAAPPGDLLIREVRTPGELAAYREAAVRGFGFPVAVARFFLDDRILAVPRLRLYAGHVGGAVVATSMLVASGAVAGIYWVATLEEHRRHGYGEALTWAAVAGGRALGCEIASLQASKAGRPVYARMGFAHVLDYAGLRPPAT